MTRPAYIHTESSRNSLTLAAFAIGLVMLGIGLAYGAPLIWLAIVFLPSLALGYMVLSGSKSGVVLDDAGIALSAGGWRKAIALADIASYSKTEWSEGPPNIALNLRNGQDIAVPPSCTGPSKRFIAELEARGVREKHQ